VGIHPTAAQVLAWCVGFTVLELEKLRRRFITAPQLNCLEEIPFPFEEDFKISEPEGAQYAVHTEAAMISDFPFFFGQMPLEVEVRNFYAFAHIDGKGEKTVYRLFASSLMCMIKQ
jgi:hypothetical protein